MDSTVAALVLVSAALHPLWNALIKRGGKPETTFLAVNLVALLVAALHTVLSRAPFLPPRSLLPLLAGSAVGQLVYGTALLLTLRRGDLSAYYPVIRASPVFIVIVGVALLGRRYSPNVLAGVAFVVLGIAVLHARVGRAPHSGSRLTLIYALIAMSASGSYSITDSLLVQGMAPSALLIWATLPGLPVYYAMHRGAAPPGIRPRLTAPVLLRDSAAGIMSYASYYCILLAYRFGGDPAAVTAVRQAAIPFSVILGGMLLREKGLGRRIVGSLILGLGIVLIVLLQ